MRRTVAKWVGLVLEELKDAWAFAAAEVTGLMTFVFGAPLWVAALSGGSVLAVRVVAGRLLPRDDAAPPQPPLTEEQKAVAHLICDGYTTEGIARVTKSSPSEVRERQHAVYAAVGSRDPARIREWLRANKIRPPRPPILQQIVTNDIVRVTATVGSLYTVYRTMLCPALHNIWPWIQCP